MPYNDGWVDVPKGAHDDGWVDVADDRTTQIARGAKMTNAEADQYMQNRARFASEGGASTFGKGGATDTRKISYTGTGYRPNKKATSGKELAKNFVQDVVELPLMPVRMASEVANSPDTPQTLADMGKGLVTTPMGFVPGLSDLATGKPASENWLTNPGIGALTVLGGAEIARQGVPKLADLASDRIASSELLNPERLARSALKPYNGEQIARQKAVTRGLETAVSDPNATPRMSKFLEKNLSEMDDIAGRQEVLLDEKGNPRVSIKGVRDSLQGTVDAARETPGTADSAVTAAERVLNDIISHPEYDAATDSIPLNTVQTMKKNIWRKLREGNTFNKDAVPGLQDAMWDAATGMNSIINEFIPEMKAENARYGELANVNKLLKKAADRHAGNNLVPLRAMIQLARGDVQGFMQGATMWAVDHPTFKMYLAQRLAKVRGKKATPTEINNITDAIKENLIQRQQTVLDSEALPKVSNGNLGDTIDPTAYSPQYGWEGKAPAAPEVANPEVLPPRQSSQMPVISDQGGRIVPQVEAMTKRVPAGFNPEVIGMGTEDVQLGDRMAPKPRPLRGLADLAPQEAPQTPKTDAHPWRQYVADNMGRAMKEEGSHGAAMKKLAQEYAASKKGAVVEVGEGFHSGTAVYLQKKLSDLNSEFPTGGKPVRIVTDERTGNMEHDAFTGDLRMRPSLAKFSPEDLNKIYTGWAKDTGTLPGLDATIDHEFAHALDGRIISKLATDADKEAYWNEKKALAERLGHPSEYAKKNNSEWLAEQFAHERANGVKGGVVDFLKEKLRSLEKVKR